MDIVIHDVNDNDVFDLYEDRIFVGATVGTRWRATALFWTFNCQPKQLFQILVMCTK